MNTGSFINLRLDLPYPVQHIETLEIQHNFNQHATAKIKIAIEKKEQEEIVRAINKKDKIAIIQQDGKEKQILFCGVPKKVSFPSKQGQEQMKLELISATIQLDREKKCRSFQNCENSYHNIFRQIIREEYQGDLIDTISKDTKQGQVLLQYQETDWQFLKRAVSQLGGFLIPEVTSQQPRLWIGYPNTEKKEIESNNYTIEKLGYPYWSKKDKQSIKNKNQIMGYEIQTEQYFSLGDTVLFQQHSWIIYKIKRKIKKGILISTYTLRQKKEKTFLPQWNSQLTGVSLEGTILQVKGDKIKLHLAIDNKQKKDDANWYSFSSMYATEGSTGWYCMPEIGTKAFLYFPTEKEEDAFVRGVSRADGKKNSQTENPSQKNIGNAKGKSMAFSAKEITYTAKKEETFLTLNEETGITIKSYPTIYLQSATSISLKGKNISLSADKKLVLQIKKENSSIVLDNSTHLKSEKIVQNGTTKR